MNRRDRELLDKQLHGLTVAPRSDVALILAILAVFFAGITFGGFLSAYTSAPAQVAANEIVPAISQLHSAPKVGTLQ